MARVRVRDITLLPAHGVDIHPTRHYTSLKLALPRRRVRARVGRPQVDGSLVGRDDPPRQALPVRRCLLEPAIQHHAAASERAGRVFEGWVQVAGAPPQSSSPSTNTSTSAMSATSTSSTRSTTCTSTASAAIVVVLVVLVLLLLLL